jgi:hypothetical protein
MLKSLIRFIFAFYSITSPLADMGLELHLLEPDHKQLESSHNIQDHHHDQNYVVSVNVFEALSFVEHEDSEHGVPHEHYRLFTGDALSLDDVDLILASHFKCVSPIRANFQLSTFDVQYTKKWQQLVALSHFPQPDQFRNLPLLN